MPNKTKISRSIDKEMVVPSSEALRELGLRIHDITPQGAKTAYSITGANGGHIFLMTISNGGQLPRRELVREARRHKLIVLRAV